MDQNVKFWCPKLARQRLTHFISFEHFLNASIFGLGLYIWDHPSITTFDCSSKSIEVGPCCRKGIKISIFQNYYFRILQICIELYFLICTFEFLENVNSKILSLKVGFPELRLRMDYRKHSNLLRK